LAQAEPVAQHQVVLVVLAEPQLLESFNLWAVVLVVA
jgi:hypothetical protein